jgi:anthranilate synthase
MEVFSYYRSALAQGLCPTLLEFTHPSKRTPLSICGIKPSTTLTAIKGRLYKDGVDVGPALDIFQHLALAQTNTFFPAFLGFFSYEFAEYFGKACLQGERAFPDAFFQYYEQGLVIDNETVLHHDVLTKTAPMPGVLLASQSLVPSLSEEQFFIAVDAVKERIRAGDVYQVNVSMPFRFKASQTDMLLLYEAMRRHNNSPFMGLMHHDDFWLLSGSPERLFSLHHNKITTRPIAGTKKRHHDVNLENDEVSTLKACPKENAEHAMLVDLMRNDLNQVCHQGSVAVDEDRTVEFYSHVMHLVSEVSGTTSASLKDIFRALFPGGTITGAPKESVMKTLADLESLPRGPYTGSLGYISSGFGIDFNILIRSVFKHGECAMINAGAGIVIDSVKENEWLEIHKKAAAINDILANKSTSKPKRMPIYGSAIEKSRDKKLSTVARVLFLENHDSFSFNIVDALRSIGAHVDIIEDQSHDNTLDDYSHVVIGPGPGNPINIPALTSFIERVTEQSMPLLGICLGHQALGHYFGAPIKKLPTPVHGQPHEIIHSNHGLFIDLLSPARFVRYHSLALLYAPQDFFVDAHTRDDCIMAIRHRTFPFFGVQFHPESYLSDGGHKILKRFLEEQRHGHTHH